MTGLSLVFYGYSDARFVGLLVAIHLSSPGADRLARVLLDLIDNEIQAAAAGAAGRP